MLSYQFKLLDIKMTFQTLKRSPSYKQIRVKDVQPIHANKV